MGSELWGVTVFALATVSRLRRRGVNADFTGALKQER